MSNRTGLPLARPVTRRRISELARRAGIATRIIVVIEEAETTGRPWSVDEKIAEQIAQVAEENVSALFLDHQRTRRIERDIICLGCNQAIPPIDGPICKRCYRIDE